ncbi:MAG: response regulator [Chloroflexi bacterium]|nr:response regulator [Chloroflexota bacterium]
MTTLEGKRVFYAEDDIKNRAAVQLTLTRAGAIVKMGRGRTISEMTLAMRAAMPLDLVLLDLMYPNLMTGYDIYAAMQADSDLCDVPVIIVSASDPAVEIPRAQELGLHGFIAKPINVRQFHNQLATCLAGEPVWDEGLSHY